MGKFSFQGGMIGLLQESPSHCISLEYATIAMKPLLESSMWSNLMAELEDWRVSLLNEQFGDIQKAFDAAKVRCTASWKAVCLSVRADDKSCLGFPVTPDVLPNPQNTAACKAIQDLASYTQSPGFTKCCQEAVGKAVATKNPLARSWEMSFRSDVVRGTFASLTGAVMAATKAGPVGTAPPAMLTKVTDTMAQVSRLLDAATSFLDKAGAEKTDAKGSTPGVSNDQVQEHAELAKCCKAFEDFVRGALIEGLEVVVNKTEEMPSGWQDDLIKNSTPGSVEKFIVGPQQTEFVRSVALAANNAQLLYDKLCDLFPALDRSKYLRAINTGKMFTCVWSIWSMLSARDSNNRARLSTAEAKTKKVKEQLGEVPLPAEVSARVDKWVRRGDAFSKKD